VRLSPARRSAHAAPYNLQGAQDGGADRVGLRLLLETTRPLNGDEGSDPTIIGCLGGQRLHERGGLIIKFKGSDVIRAHGIS
jgi:hypothetical protein